MNQLKIGTFLMVAYMAKKDREEEIYNLDLFNIKLS